MTTLTNNIEQPMFYFEKNVANSALNVSASKFFRANSEEIASQVIKRIIAQVLSKSVLELDTNACDSFVRPFYTANFLVDESQVRADIMLHRQGSSIKLANVRIAYDYIHGVQPTVPHILMCVSDVNYMHFESVNKVISQLLKALCNIEYSAQSFYKDSIQSLYAQELKKTFYKMADAWRGAQTVVGQYQEQGLLELAPEAFVLSSDYGERACAQWQNPQKSQECYCLLSKFINNSDVFGIELSTVELDWNAKKAGKPSVSESKFILRTITDASLEKGASFMANQVLSSVFNP